jgi:hypothetical protein
VVVGYKKNVRPNNNNFSSSNYLNTDLFLPMSTKNKKGESRQTIFMRGWKQSIDDACDKWLKEKGLPSKNKSWAEQKKETYNRKKNC